ncbi:Cation/H(+) antiporter 15 [Striga hermonthica]|uniref:Cation/H(+) antiporter 15 n=1 Tax=Striga hermonthica TaxID=68872 RepID=A0A9N7NDK7_STRHE|nr:Cation/H(+) antiporter 15 [Striga hermonthica]
MSTTNLMDIDISRLNKTILCYAETIYRFNGLWEGPDPLTPLISLFLIQLTFSMSFIHLLVYALKPFNQPPFVAELLGGILLGPSAFGRITTFRKLLFPNYSFKVLEPMAHLSITLYAFLVGLKMDVKAILRLGPKSTKVSVATISIPFSVGCGLFFLFAGDHDQWLGCLFWGSALASTGFSILTRILDRQQILHTEAGKTAASSALVADISTWALLALSLAATSSRNNIHWSIISTTAFVLLCVYYVRPALGWAIRKTPEGQGYSEFYICSVLAGMFVSGVLTDVFGTHPMIGAFVFGLVIPNEVLEATIADKLEDFVVGILLPVYFVVCGLRTNVDAVSTGTSWAVVGSVVVVACAVKAFGALLVAAFSEFPIDEALAVGLLTNAKSVMALVVLETGQIQGVLNTQMYSVMVVAVLVMTMIVTPAAIYYRPVQNLTPYKRRTVQKAKSDDELRVLACIYDPRNVPPLIHILRTTHASPRSPLSVFAVQLVELVGRASAATTLVAHAPRRRASTAPNHHHHHGGQVEAQADQMVAALDNYELRSQGVRTHAYTARCPLATMDDDISNVARDKRAALILLPFHRQQSSPNEPMDEITPATRAVNEAVLSGAPCSVGILADRGFAGSHDHAANIALLYFGGPDDREALAYAWRMAGGEGVSLTVVRFISSGESANGKSGHMEDPSDGFEVSLEMDYEQERLLDDDYLQKFRTATADDKSISYFELVLNDEEEAIKAIKSMDGHGHDLYVVGRGRGMVCPLTSGLADWCDCPELGPIGDLLVTSEFESVFSVLIVQQYVKTNRSREGSIRSSNSGNYGEEMVMRPSLSGSDGGLEHYGSFREWDHEN